MGLSNVHFLPSIPKRAVPAFLAEMDSLFIGWRKLPIYRFGINPNKLFDYLMAGKPVIHSVEAGNDMVKDAGAGFSVGAEDPAAIAEAVRRMLATTPNERGRMGAAGRQYVLAHHDYRVLAQRSHAGGAAVRAADTTPLLHCHALPCHCPDSLGGFVGSTKAKAGPRAKNPCKPVLTARIIAVLTSMTGVMQHRETGE